MNMRWVGILFLGIGVGLSACSDDDGGDDGGSGSGDDTKKLRCLVEDNGDILGCNEHTIPSSAFDASADACTNGGGTVVDACPTEGLVGKCSTAMGALIVHVYEPETAADAEESCTTVLGGTWTPA